MIQQTRLLTRYLCRHNSAKVRWQFGWQQLPHLSLPINQVLEENRALFETILSQTDAPRSLGLTQDEVFGLFDLKSRKKEQREAA